MNETHQKAAFVTGSSRGIGQGIAFSLAERGFAVAINCETDLEGLRETEERLKDVGAKVVAIPGSVADLGSHERMLSDAEDAIGPLTTLVNNAGVSAMIRGDLLDVSPASYDRCLEVNAKAPFFLSQAFAKRVLGRDKRPEAYHSIINITSVNALAASINRGEYCTSKAAQSMVSKLFAVRLADDEIFVFEIQPGLIRTEMSRPAWEKYDKLSEQGLTLIRRMGTPQEMGEIAAMAATGCMPYMTGQPLMADAGLLIPRF